MDAPEIIVEEITDAVELEQAQNQRRQFDANLAWFEANAAIVYRTHRGKCVCVAGQELFIGETPTEALTKARAAHPEDRGQFIHYIPKDKVPRIYADCRAVVRV